MKPVSDRSNRKLLRQLDELYEQINKLNIDSFVIEEELKKRGYVWEWRGDNPRWVAPPKEKERE